MRLYRLRRHPFGFWLVTFLLAGLTAAAVLRIGARAEAEVARWGRLTPVVVMARAVAAGSVVGAADVRVEQWPSRLVPVDAVASVDGAVGRVAVVGLGPGEPLLRRRLAPDGLSGLAALVPPGMRAIALPVDGPGLALHVGDAVDVLATFDAEPTVLVVSAAPVVAVGDGAVTVAVPAADTPRLAYAATRSTLTLALSAISTGTGPVKIGGVDR